MTIYHLLFNRLTLFITYFSESSVAENVSIKNNKLCKTNPISEKSKVRLNLYPTKDYENKSGLLTMEKQTQSNPTVLTLRRAGRAGGRGAKSYELRTTRLRIPFFGCSSGLSGVRQWMSASVRREIPINPALHRFPSLSFLRNNTGR